MLFDINTLLQGLSRDSLAFLPELLVCGVIVLLLVLRLLPFLDRLHLGWVALIATLAILAVMLGMMLMASANHLLMIYLAVEMASLPSYALAGFLKGRRQSSEAALKYVVYGGGAAGVMLYGISLLAGKFGTAYLPDLAYGIVASTDPKVV